MPRAPYYRKTFNLFKLSVKRDVSGQNRRRGSIWFFLLLQLLLNDHCATFSSTVKPLFNLLIRNNNTFARIWHYCSKFIYSQISLLIYFCGWHIYEQIKFIEITRLRYCYDFRTWYMCRGYLPRSFPSPSLGCYYIITLKWIRENKIRRWIHPEIVCYMNEL